MSSRSPRRQQDHGRMHLVLLLSLIVMLLAACGGSRGRGEPTALPPDVVRPAQPTPVFKNSARVFRLTPDPTPPSRPIAASGRTSDGAIDAVVAPVPTLAAYAQLRIWLPERPPTALAIVRSSATLLDAPDGAALEQLSAGATVTVTGRAADRRHVAVYTDTGIAGWIQVNRLILYGDEDLVEVEQALGMGPIATMIAEAME
jgi:hypothetical protein